MVSIWPKAISAIGNQLVFYILSITFLLMEQSHKQHRHDSNHSIMSSYLLTLQDLTLLYRFPIFAKYEDTFKIITILKYLGQIFFEISFSSTSPFF